MSNESENKRIDLEHLEEDALLQDLNWSIARFEQVETLVKEMIAELKRCYEEIDRVRAIAEDLHAYIVSNADISLSVAEKQMDWVEASEWGN